MEAGEGARTGRHEGSVRPGGRGGVVARLSSLTRRRAGHEAQRNARRTVVCGSALAAAALVLIGASPASAQDEDALILLGKNFFFDKQLSTPRGKQSCASCHDPAAGWTLPLSNINQTTVGAPGAQPGAQGTRKPQNNSYVQGFLGEYNPGLFGPVTTGGAFWDGRAEGCGASTNDLNCQVGTGNVSETITPADLPPGSPHVQFLGPVADQALNPTSRPGVEQNTREKSVCQMVKTAKYKDLYEEAWGEPIDCNQQGAPPAYHISFKRLAVAVAAWQGSADVNSFSSPRDACISGEADDDGVFPCDNLSDEADLGHDLFYGRNDSGLNDPLVNAGCSLCHNNKGGGSDGNEPDQLYTDFAYHSIGLPFNPDLNGNETPGQDSGLAEHDALNSPIGLDTGVFKTPTLRNATKGDNKITKAFMHHGYFKTIEQVVHFYNTRFDGTAEDADPVNNSKVVCEDIGLPQATAAEAITNDCWPVSEFPENDAAISGLVGNLGLTEAQEAALVAYIRSLEDTHTPTKPSTVK
jgi:cytochrome c peroxidase